MNHIEELDELLEGHGFLLWEWAADGTACWEHTEHQDTAFPLTTRAYVAHADQGRDLVFRLEHMDFRGPFYTKPLDQLDHRELDTLLRTVITDDEGDED